MSKIKSNDLLQVGYDLSFKFKFVLCRDLARLSEHYHIRQIKPISDYEKKKIFLYYKTEFICV